LRHKEQIEIHHVKFRPYYTSILIECPEHFNDLTENIPLPWFQRFATCIVMVLAPEVRFIRKIFLKNALTIATDSRRDENKNICLL
jgi:hypothetical protein